MRLSWLALFALGCNAGAKTIPYDKLSDYQLLTQTGGQISYAGGVVPYDLNTPLFSDYALKSRAVMVPPGQAAVYDADGPLQFPTGTIVMKSFGFAPDERDPTTGGSLVETRLLIKRSAGWLGVPYVWDAAQKDALLSPAGGMPTIDFINAAGASEEAHYLIPTEGQCKECHDATGTFDVLGLKARQLNRDFDYGGTVENQLTHWANAGILSGAPADPTTAPKLPVWDDPSTGSVDARARAWLEANCAHCHNETGLARTTGLYLLASESDPAKFGVCKSPVAAGPGTGGNHYDIVPGDPDHSILIFRIESVEPGLMMPQIGRSVVHTEGVALIREWIQAMSGACN
jgi:uncharacterized repeat protein (TIGR03806 family)